MAEARSAAGADAVQPRTRPWRAGRYHKDDFKVSAPNERPRAERRNPWICNSTANWH
jgi:hypothetical protein